VRQTIAGVLEGGPPASSRVQILQITSDNHPGLSLKIPVITFADRVLDRVLSSRAPEAREACRCLSTGVHFFAGNPACRGWPSSVRLSALNKVSAIIDVASALSLSAQRSITRQSSGRAPYPPGYCSLAAENARSWRRACSSRRLGNHIRS
jgi:hypothetical protein